MFEPTEIYLLQETDIDNNLISGAGTWVGAQWSIQLSPQQWHAKFVAMHEYGHLVTAHIPMFHAGHPFLDSDVDYGPDDSHRFRSPEFHATAALEGFAHFIALAAWHDLANSPVNVTYVDLFEAGVGGQATTRYVINFPVTNCLDYSTNPQSAISCGDGMSHEVNWARALYGFFRSSSAPSLSVIAGMLEPVHVAPWYPNGANLDFVEDFDDAMSTYLTMAEYVEWSDEVVDNELDCCSP